MNKFEEKYPYFWLILGLILTLLSYGIFNTGICAWIFAIPYDTVYQQSNQVVVHNYDAGRNDHRRQHHLLQACNG